MSKMESFSWLYLLFLFCTSQFICLSSFISSSSSGHLCHLDDSSALLQFKNSFSIDTSGSDSVYVYRITPYPKTVYWNKGKDCCAWSGVTCERMTGHVIGLNLGYSGLQGNIHHNSSLFSLRHLRRLDLSNNNFRGSPVSSNFGGFVSMTHLDLSNSNFTGQIPFEISYLSRLVSLNLSSDETQVSLGTVSLKRIAQNLTNLKELCLDSVNMSSVVLDSFMNLSSSLTSLRLIGSSLKGKFPEKIFRLPNLHELDLRYNDELNGSFPKSNWSSPLKFLGHSWTRISIDLPYLTTTLKCLSVLYLGHCNFVGAYPTLLGNLTQITKLDLSDNGFGGQIPWPLLNMESLISLDLSNNNFLGQLLDLHSNSTQMPASLYDSSKERLVGPIPLHLNFLILYNNALTGTIPSWLYILPSLEALSLNNNQFTGYVKEFQSSSLMYLDFGRNRLHGQIPRSIFEFPNLGELDLSSNNFSGFVKFGKFQNLLRHLLLSNNSLTGGIPSKICNLSSLVVLDLSNNNMSGEIPPCIGNLTSHKC